MPVFAGANSGNFVDAWRAPRVRTAAMSDWEAKLEGHFSSAGTSNLAVQVDLWLTLLAAIACVETALVCGLAVHRYAAKVYHMPLQRWTIRIILIGPVFSCLMWVSLWAPGADYYIGFVVGFYAAYAFFCFYAMLACFADGEERLGTALAALPGPPTAYAYHPFGTAFSYALDRVATCGGLLPSCGPLHLGTYTPLFSGWVHYSAVRRFDSPVALLRFLKAGVAQAMVIKPLNLALMLSLDAAGHGRLCNYSRILSALSFWLVANSLTQLYHAVLPRIRGHGSENLFGLLLVAIVVLIVQELVVAALLIASDTTAATEYLPSRLIFILTILEFTAFSTIFYRLLPPEKFAHYAWRHSTTNLRALAAAPPAPTKIPLCDFVALVLNPRTMFAVAHGRVSPEPYRIRAHVFGSGVRERKDDDDDERTGLVRKL